MELCRNKRRETMDHKIVEAFMRVGKCHRTLLDTT